MNKQSVATAKLVSMGHVIDVGIVSNVRISKVQVELFPDSSVAVMIFGVTTIAPLIIVPGNGLCVVVIFIAEEQLSVLTTKDV